MLKLSILFTLFRGHEKRTVMKYGKILIMAGIIMAISGSIFHLQGHAIVGPESSFMYANPEWVSYGLQIIVIGIITGSTGFVILKKNDL